MNPPHLRVVGAPSPTCNFLRVFHGERPWPLIAINRATKDTKFATFEKSETRDTDALAWAAQWNLAAYDIYFSINPQKYPNPRNMKASKEDILQIEWLQGDLDPPKGMSEEDIEVWRPGKLAEARAGCIGVPHPTLIVDSARGFWLFWKLRTPVGADGDGPVTQAVESYGKTIAVLLGADNCSNIDRIARLPGFINHRPGVPPRKATVLDYWSDRTYELKDFPAAKERPTDLKSEGGSVDSDLLDDEAATAAVIAYLETVDIAIDGQGGRTQARDVLQRCQDLGCRRETSLDLMETHWCERCQPRWDREELSETLRGLKRRDPIGVHHPAIVTDYRNELARREFEHVAPKAGDLTGTYYHFPDPQTIPPRQFLYGGHYVRQFASATIAPTKVGKSSLGIVEALAMASGKPLLGELPRGMFRVRIWNGEDPWMEMVRRIAAAMQHYGLTESDIGDRLIVDSGREMPIAIATKMRSGAVIQVPVRTELIRAIEAQKVDVLLIDPFISSHRVSENDNDDIDTVAKEFSSIADVTRIAIDLIHHSRKLNGAEASIEDARGASALVSAVRSARALAKMTKAEAMRLGLEGVRQSLFRFTDSQSNMAPPRSGELEQWFELRSERLCNGVGVDALEKALSGDSVQVVGLFDTAKAAEKEMLALMKQDSPEGQAAEKSLLDELSSGDWRWSAKGGEAWAGVAIARHLGFELDTPDDKERAKKVLKLLTDSGKIRAKTGFSSSKNKCSFVEVVLHDVNLGLFD